MKPFKSVLMVILAAGSGTLSAATDVWTSLGPGGGAIERLVVDPHRPSILYAVAGGGVFKTVNGGITWSLAISAVSSGGVRNLVIHPQNPNTLYAVGGPRGLKSTDGGISWSSLNLPESLPLHTYTLAVDPGSGTLYARTCNGIARSTDGGESWVENVFPPPAYCFALLALDASTGALFTTHTTYTDIGSVSERTGRILKSEDGGETWSVLELGVTSVAALSLAIDPQNPNTIYALAVGSIGPADYQYGAWVFKTNDGGASWVISTRLDAGGRGAISVDSQNPSTIYVATRSSVLRSTDAGASWKPLALAEGPQWFWSPSSVTALAIAPSVSLAERSSLVYVGTYTRGVWKSADEGETWTGINSGLTANNIQSVLVDPQNPGTLYGVQGGVEIVKTSDGGMTWRSADSGLPRDAFLGPLAIDPQNPARVYTATSWQGVFRTTDGGTSWEAANSGLPGAVNSVAIDPQNSSTLYAGIGDESCWEYGRCYWSGVFKSTDGGESWSYSGLSGYWVGRVVVAPLNSNVIYAVGFLPRSACSEMPWPPRPSQTCEGFLPPSAGVASEAWYWGSPAFFRSTNGGASWDVLKLPTPSFELAIDPQEPNTAYVYGDIFKTNDGGESWSAFDLPSVRALAIDPQTPSTLYAGTGNGVFRSTDGGASWTAVNSGLTSLAIDTLAIDPQNPSTVFAGTSGGGVFSITFTSQSTPRE